MAQRGRKSRAQIQTPKPFRVINLDNERLKPPAYLTKEGRQVFDEVVSSCDPKHFRKGELPVLCAFCEAVALSRYYTQALRSQTEEGVSFSHKEWLDATKLLTTLATRLRLTPHSRFDARAAQRMGPPAMTTFPWDYTGKDGESESDE
jgi:phage terminase small subunit